METWNNLADASQVSEGAKPKQFGYRVQFWNSFPCHLLFCFLL